MQLQSMRKHLASYPAALYGLLFLAGVLITGAGHLLRLSFFTGCAAGVTVLFALYGLWGLSMHLAGGFLALRTCGKRALLGCLLLVAVIEVFFAVEMANQHTIYYWDQADYWQKTVEASQKLFTQPGYFLKQVYGSILNYDYNLLIPLVLALPTRIFGTAHITHILLIVNLFLLPAAFTLAVAARTVCAKKVPLPILFGLSAFSPVLLYPALAGYLDSFSLLTLSIAFLVGSGQAVFRFTPQRCIVLALALVATMLGRRYFCYAAVGFFVWGAFVRAALSCMPAGQAQRRPCIFQKPAFEWGYNDRHSALRLEIFNSRGFYLLCRAVQGVPDGEHAAQFHAIVAVFWPFVCSHLPAGSGSCFQTATLCIFRGDALCGPFTGFSFISGAKHGAASLLHNAAAVAADAGASARLRFGLEGPWAADCQCCSVLLYGVKFSVCLCPCAAQRPFGAIYRQPTLFAAATHGHPTTYRAGGLRQHAF